MFVWFQKWFITYFIFNKGFNVMAQKKKQKKIVVHNILPTLPTHINQFSLE